MNVSKAARAKQESGRTGGMARIFMKSMKALSSNKPIKNIPRKDNEDNHKETTLPHEATNNNASVRDLTISESDAANIKHTNLEVRSSQSAKNEKPVTRCEKILSQDKLQAPAESDDFGSKDKEFKEVTPKIHCGVKSLRRGSHYTQRKTGSFPVKKVNRYCQEKRESHSFQSLRHSRNRKCTTAGVKENVVEMIEDWGEDLLLVGVDDKIMNTTNTCLLKDEKKPENIETMTEGELNGQTVSLLENTGAGDCTTIHDYENSCVCVQKINNTDHGKDKHVHKEDSNTQDKGILRVDSDTQDKGIIRVDSDNQDKDIIRVDSVTQDKGIIRVDSDAQDKGIIRVDSVTQDKGIIRVDSDAQDKGIIRVDSVTQDKGIFRVDSVTQDKGIIRVDSVTQDKGIFRVDSVTQDKGIIRVDSVTQDKGIIRVDSDTQDKGIIRVDSDAQDKGIIRVDSDNQDNGIIRVDSDTQDKGIIRVDSDNQDKGIIRVDSVTQDKGIIRVDSVTQDKGIIRVDSDTQDKGIIRVDSDNQDKGIIREDSDNQDNGIIREDSDNQDKGIIREDSDNQDKGFVREDSNMLDKDDNREDSNTLDNGILKEDINTEVEVVNRDLGTMSRSRANNILCDVTVATLADEVEDDDHQNEIDVWHDCCADLGDRVRDKFKGVKVDNKDHDVCVVIENTSKSVIGNTGDDSEQMVPDISYLKNERSENESSTNKENVCVPGKGDCFDEFQGTGMELIDNRCAPKKTEEVVQEDEKIIDLMAERLEHTHVSLESCIEGGVGNMTSCECNEINDLAEKDAFLMDGTKIEQYARDVTGNGIDLNGSRNLVMESSKTNYKCDKPEDVESLRIISNDGGVQNSGGQLETDAVDKKTLGKSGDTRVLPLYIPVCDIPVSYNYKCRPSGASASACPVEEISNECASLDGSKNYSGVEKVASLLDIKVREWRESSSASSDGSYSIKRLRQKKSRKRSKSSKGNINGRGHTVTFSPPQRPSDLDLPLEKQSRLPRRENNLLHGKDSVKLTYEGMIHSKVQAVSVEIKSKSVSGEQNKSSTVPTCTAKSAMYQDSLRAMKLGSYEPRRPSGPASRGGRHGKDQLVRDTGHKNHLETLSSERKNSKNTFKSFSETFDISRRKPDQDGKNTKKPEKENWDSELLNLPLSVISLSEQENNSENCDCVGSSCLTCDELESGQAGKNPEEVCVHDREMDGTPVCNKITLEKCTGSKFITSDVRNNDEEASTQASVKNEVLHHDKSYISEHSRSSVDTDMVVLPSPSKDIDNDCAGSVQCQNSNIVGKNDLPDNKSNIGVKEFENVMTCNCKDKPKYERTSIDFSKYNSINENSTYSTINNFTKRNNKINALDTCQTRLDESTEDWDLHLLDIQSILKSQEKCNSKEQVVPGCHEYEKLGTEDGMNSIGENSDSVSPHLLEKCDCALDLNYNEISIPDNTALFRDLCENNTEEFQVLNKEQRGKDNLLDSNTSVESFSAKNGEMDIAEEDVGPHTQMGSSLGEISEVSDFDDLCTSDDIVESCVFLSQEEYSTAKCCQDDDAFSATASTEQSVSPCKNLSPLRHQSYSSLSTDDSRGLDWRRPIPPGYGLSRCVCPAAFVQYWTWRCCSCPWGREPRVCDIRSALHYADPVYQPSEHKDPVKNSAPGRYSPRGILGMGVRIPPPPSKELWNEMQQSAGGATEDKIPPGGLPPPGMVRYPWAYSMKTCTSSPPPPPPTGSGVTMRQHSPYSTRYTYPPPSVQDKKPSSLESDAHVKSFFTSGAGSQPYVSKTQHTGPTATVEKSCVSKSTSASQDTANSHKMKDLQLDSPKLVDYGLSETDDSEEEKSNRQKSSKVSLSVQEDAHSQDSDCSSEKRKFELEEGELRNEEDCSNMSKRRHVLPKDHIYHFIRHSIQSDPKKSELTKKSDIVKSIQDEKPSPYIPPHRRQKITLLGSSDANDSGSGFDRKSQQISSKQESLNEATTSPSRKQGDESIRTAPGAYPWAPFWASPPPMSMPLSPLYGYPQPCMYPPPYYYSPEWYSSGRDSYGGAYPQPSSSKTLKTPERKVIPPSTGLKEDVDLSSIKAGENPERLVLPPRIRFLQKSRLMGRDTDSESSSSVIHFDWKARFKDKCKTYCGTYIDSHCHLDFLFNRQGFKGTWSKYKIENEATIPESFEGCVAVFCYPGSFRQEGLWKEIALEEDVWLTFGCHPKNATEFTSRAEEGLLKCLQHKKVVALGEIGLDYSGIFRQHETVQKSVFIRQITIALEMNKPLVIHCREAEEDTLQILEKMVPRNYKIHCHCFTGNYESAKKWMNLFPNLYIGLTPLVSYKTATPSHEVARFIPLERLLLETDAPYFVPRKFPKEDVQFSHPGMAITVAEHVAFLKRCSVTEVLHACRQNTRSMYGV